MGASCTHLAPDHEGDRCRVVLGYTGFDGMKLTVGGRYDHLYFFTLLSKTATLRRFQMAHKITDACLACGTCVPECPVEAISESDPIYIIDAAKCTDCTACVQACPAEAIVPA